MLINDEDIINEVHWDPRMGTTTLSHLTAFSSIDGDLFNFLVLNGHDPCIWGVLNEYNPVNSPQYNVITQLSCTTAEPVSI